MDKSDMNWTKKKTHQFIEIMEMAYPQPECALHFESVFQLLIAVTLSAQTTDKQVNVVTAGLFEKYPDAKAMSRATEEELANLIQRIGLYRVKAKNILKIAQILEADYQGIVPIDHHLLTALPGVGRKTANVVLAVGFGIPAIAVDTHVFRVVNRIGIAKATTVLKTEYELMEQIPIEKWIHMHHALIWHGRLVCSARKPKCLECPVNSICTYTSK